MVETVRKVDLRKYPQIAEHDTTLLNKDSKAVCIFEAKNHDDARAQAEKVANRRLEKIAYTAIKINDEFTDNYYTLNISAPLQNAYRDVVGGYLRQRAYNSLQHLKTHEEIKPGEIPDVPTSRTTEILDALCLNLFGKKPTPLDGFTPDQLSKLAQYTFNGNSILHRLYTVPAKDPSDNITIYEAIINSEKYNSLPDERDRFTGFQLNSYEIPKEYQNFVKAFINGREDLSASEAQKFVDIAKALETINAYEKPQQHGSAVDVEKEDIDFFDISGDGLLNRGDVCTLELFLKSEADPEIKALLHSSQKENWNNLNYLKTISKSKNDKTTKNLFDLNGDGNADEKDYELYQKIIKNPHKFDINGDNFVDEKDVKLIDEYFQAVIAQSQEAVTYRQNFEKVAGGKENVERLQKKLFKN